jgi:hypothetical protein
MALLTAKDSVLHTLPYTSKCFILRTCPSYSYAYRTETYYLDVMRAM